MHPENKRRLGWFVNAEDIRKHRHFSGRFYQKWITGLYVKHKSHGKPWRAGNALCLGSEKW